MTLKVEIELEKSIKEFIKKPLIKKADLFEFIEWYLLNPSHEFEYSKKVAFNFVDITFDYFFKLSKRKKIYFLKATDNFFDTVLTMKIWGDQLLLPDSSVSYWKDTPLYFSGLGLMTKKLKNLKYNLAKIEPKRSGDKFILVEGESELHFIETIQYITNLSNFDFEVTSYGGKAEHNNLVHLIKDKNKQGVQVFLSYDCDGKDSGLLQKLKKRGANPKRLFGFKYDFESSFPPNILSSAINSYIKNHLNNKITVVEQEVKILMQNKKPFIKFFEEKFDIKLNKVILASYLGEIMSRHVNENWHEIVNKKNKKKIYKFEIFNFINFLVKH